MASLNDIVTVTITSNTRTPTRVGFGTPLVLAYHTRFAEKVRTYSELDGMASDGFTTSDAAYRMVQALFSQDPRPAEAKVGRLPAAHDHTQTLTVLTAVEDDVLTLSVQAPGTTTATAISYTVLAAATTSTVATAVAALINAISGVDAAAVSAVITVDPTTPGGMVYLRDIRVNGERAGAMDVEDTTAAAGYDTELTALRLIDDDWYFVCLDVNSEANVDPVAAWTEARVKMFLAQTMDSGELDGTGTLLSGLAVLDYKRTGTLFVDAIQEYGATAWVGRVAPKDPGSITFKFKSLVGVTPSSLTDTQEGFLETSKGNFYTTVAGLNITTEGYAASGEYLDLTHGTDWLVARLQERTFALMANADKIPYSDASVDLFIGEIFAQMEIAVDRNFLLAGTLTASGPKVADVALADRVLRILPDIKFGANFAGAVHAVRLAGTLSV